MALPSFDEAIKDKGNKRRLPDFDEVSSKSSLPDFNQVAPEEPIRQPATTPNPGRLPTNLPGGVINPANLINRARNSKLGTAVDRFTQGVGKGIGLTQEQMSPEANTGSDTADKILGGAGQLTSYFVNPGGLSQGPLALYRAAGNLRNTKPMDVAAKLLPNEGVTLNRAGTGVVDTLANKALQEGAKGLTVGAAYGVPSALIQGKTSAEDIAKTAALEGGIGGVTGAAAPVVGAGLKAAGRKLVQLRRTPKADTPGMEAISTPISAKPVTSSELEVTRKTWNDEYKKFKEYQDDLYDKYGTEWRQKTPQQEIEILDNLNEKGSTAYHQYRRKREAFREQQIGSEATSAPETIHALPIKARVERRPVPAKEPTVLDDLVKSKGHQEVNPESIAQTYNTKNWYHGTGTDQLNKDSLDPFAGSHESLFGQGIYLTDNPKIAQGYASNRGRRSKTPTVYESNVNVNRVLDLEKPITPEVSAAIQKVADNFDYHDEGYISGAIRQEIARPGATPESVIQLLRNEVGDLSRKEMIPSSEFVENFQDLAIYLKQAGYDGLTHTGGARTGKDPHRVLIMLDPQDAYGAGNKQVSRFEKYTPPAVPKRRELSPKSLKKAREFQRQKADAQEMDEILQAVKESRIRDRVYTYLDEQEKAAKERIEKRRNRLSANPVDEWADHAIIMAAKVGKGTIKAADFTEELVKEFGEKARPHAARILHQTKEILRKQEREASKQGKAARDFNESGEGDASSFDAKISRNVKKKKTPFRERMAGWRSDFTDDLAELERLEKDVAGEVASAEDSLYKSARLFKGVPERAHQIVQTRIAPIMDAVEKAGYTPEDLGRFALARHAKDVNAAGYTSGFTNAEIDDVLRQLDNPEMEAARKQLNQISKDMMREMVESGVVSKQLADVLEERWPNYVPLFRSFDDDKVEFSKGLANTLANVTSPIKALQGSKKDVIDPIENMVKNVFQSVNAAERNKVASQLAKLVKKDPDGSFIRKLEPNETVGRKNVVNVKVDGEDVKYEVEPEVYKALLNLDKDSSSRLIRVLSKPASLLRAGATLTPEFSLRNPARDIVQAYVVSKSGFNPITDFGVGLIQSISKGKLYQDWVDNLGAYGNILSTDRNVTRQAVERVLKEKPSKKFVNLVTGKSLIRLLRAISDTTESATKVGEYRAALRKGVSPQEAAYRSRDIMDFARAGSSIRQANKIVAFLNANIQGKSKLIRSIKENPAGVTARAFSAITVPTLAIYALNHSLASDIQKQTLDDAPDWLRDSFWLVAIPGTDVVGRIPKPFDLAPIFANLPERALQFIKEKDPESFDGFVQRTVSGWALPMQITGLWPFIEGMANYSFFRKGPITPEREQGLEYRDQYDPIRTTETAKLLAGAAEKITRGKGMFKNFSSPRIMDNTIRGLTAGLGTYGTDAIDAILKGTNLVDRPDAPKKSIEHMPVARSFLVDPMQSGRSMDKFYAAKEKLTNRKGSAKLNEEPFTENDTLNYANKVADEIGKINKAVREIERGDLSAKVKRELIEPLIRERNRLAKTAVTDGGL